MEISHVDRNKKTNQQLKIINRDSKNIMVWGRLGKGKHFVALDSDH